MDGVKRTIAIAGNIGAGKSTLTELLSQKFGWEAFYEAVDENPYLADFYRDMNAWSFHSQVFFLARRLRHYHELLKRSHSVIQDRSVYEDAEVFARNLYLQGHMNERDYGTYRDIYESVSLFIPPPDLVVYLRASVPTLMARIAKRGREYERSISGEYVAQLNCLYEEWIERFDLCPVLTIPADELDFVADPHNLDIISERIRDKLSGKETIEL
jgi:deoxyadenosine/deoxycytidine kinase